MDLKTAKKIAFITGPWTKTAKEMAFITGPWTLKLLKKLLS
jgi:hypothetical protein